MKQIRNMMMTIGALFAAIGLFFVIFGAVQCAQCNYLMLEGVSVEAQAQWYGSDDLWFSFEAEGKQWEVKSFFQSDSIRSGDRVVLRYKSGDPMSARITDWWTYGIFMIMGGIFAMIGFIFILWQVRIIQLENSLKDRGVKVQAQVVSVEQLRSVRIGGVCPYVIRAVCEHPYTGAQMQVKSRLLMYDPSPYLAEGKIDVLVDRMEEKRYHMLVDEMSTGRAVISVDEE